MFNLGYDPNILQYGHTIWVLTIRDVQGLGLEEFLLKQPIPVKGLI